MNMERPVKEVAGEIKKWGDEEKTILQRFYSGKAGKLAKAFVLGTAILFGEGIADSKFATAEEHFESGTKSQSEENRDKIIDLFGPKLKKTEEEVERNIKWASDIFEAKKISKTSQLSEKELASLKDRLRVYSEIVPGRFLKFVNENKENFLGNNQIREAIEDIIYKSIGKEIYASNQEIVKLFLSDYEKYDQKVREYEKKNGVIGRISDTDDILSKIYNKSIRNGEAKEHLKNGSVEYVVTMLTGRGINPNKHYKKVYEQTLKELEKFIEFDSDKFTMTSKQQTIESSAKEFFKLITNSPEGYFEKNFFNSKTTKLIERSFEVSIYASGYSDDLPGRRRRYRMTPVMESTLEFIDKNYDLFKKFPGHENYLESILYLMENRESSE